MDQATFLFQLKRTQMHEPDESLKAEGRCDAVHSRGQRSDIGRNASMALEQKQGDDEVAS